MIVTEPQLLMVKLPGPTRSFICAVPEFPEVRLTAYALPKLLQVPAGNTPAPVRSTPASPNSLRPSVELTDVPVVELSAGGVSASTAVEPTLTAASANPPAVRSVA